MVSELTKWGRWPTQVANGPLVEGVAVRRRLPGAGDVESPTVVLRAAVIGLRRDLAAYPVELPDRGVAEDELARLDAMLADGVVEVAALRGALLLITAALGSVSALAPALGQVRSGIDVFGGLTSRRGG